MEKLMQYVWQHRLYGNDVMQLVDGRTVRIIDQGTLNTDAGPDFFNAKVEIDGNVWVGNIEIHVRASDWYRHGHDKDAAYDNVVLHVVEKDDAPVTRTDGHTIPQVVMACSRQFADRYNAFVGSQSELPCAPRIKDLPSITISEWMESLAFERLQSKAERIVELSKAFNGSWEDVCYVTLSRNLGFGINNDAFERLARRTPLRILHKHSDSLLQIEALLFGQAGMLSAEDFPNDVYYQQLCREYSFLSNKFGLTPIEQSAWKLFRIRPQNFPHNRIAMLAQFVYGGFRLMNSIQEAKDYKAFRELFSVQLTGYWTTHYSFGKPSPVRAQALSASSIDIILINTVAPLLYARGELVGDYLITDKAVALLEEIKPEKNSIVAQFVHAGMPCRDAMESQALIQLRRAYCEARKCLYCHLGHKLLSQLATEP